MRAPRELALAAHATTTHLKNDFSTKGWAPVGSPIINHVTCAPGLPAF